MSTSVVTAEPAVVTAEPADVTAEPAVVTAEPAVVTAEPAVVTAELAVDTAEPAIDTAEPAVVTAELAVDTAEPVIDTAEPAVVIAEPADVIADPAFVIAESAVVTAEPAIDTAESAVVTEPVFAVAEPAVVTAEPADGIAMAAATFNAESTFGSVESMKTFELIDVVDITAELLSPKSDISEDLGISADAAAGESAYIPTAEAAATTPPADASKSKQNGAVATEDSETEAELIELIDQSEDGGHEADQSPEDDDDEEQEAGGGLTTPLRDMLHRPLPRVQEEEPLPVGEEEDPVEAVSEASAIVEEHSSECPPPRPEVLEACADILEEVEEEEELAQKGLCETDPTSAVLSCRAEVILQESLGQADPKLVEPEAASGASVPLSAHTTTDDEGVIYQLQAEPETAAADVTCVSEVRPEEGWVEPPAGFADSPERQKRVPPPSELPVTEDVDLLELVATSIEVEVCDRETAPAEVDFSEVSFPGFKKKSSFDLLQRRIFDVLYYIQCIIILPNSIA